MINKQELDKLIVYCDSTENLINLIATKRKAEDAYYDYLWFDDLKSANTVKTLLTGVNNAIYKGRDVEPSF